MKNMEQFTNKIKKLISKTNEDKNKDDTDIAIEISLK